MNNSRRLFVYGTLRDGGSASHLLDTGLPYKINTVVDLPLEMVNVNGMFPGLILSEEVNEIVGDIVDIPNSLVLTLDKYEGVPSLYTREIFTIEGIQTIVYVLNPDVQYSHKIPGGDWFGE